MKEKDITEKMLADYNDVFADIVNVLLFNGRHVVDEHRLVSTKDRQQFKADGEIHEEERDVSKIVQGKNVRVAFIGVEHQTDVDADEPFRTIAYDGVSYKAQLISGDKQRYPVVTIVLYFGMGRWNKAKSLYEALDISDEWKPYVNDYKINLFEIAYLTDEQVGMFKSDFRFVADYFVQMRKNKDYVPSKESIRHVDAVLKLLSVLTKDNRFEEAQRISKDGERNMCDVFDKYEARGKAEGVIVGKVELLCEDGRTPAEIAERLSIPIEDVERIIAAELVTA